MSFEIMVIAADESRLLPRTSDVLRAFEGHVVSVPGESLVVGSQDGKQVEISADWNPEEDTEQTLITINQPMDEAWLWDGVLTLLRRFDVFLMVPDAPEAWGAVARTDVTIPPEVRAFYGFVEVNSADELRAAFDNPPVGAGE
jgi:hypothetical protein